MMYGQWKRGIKFYEINKEENHNTHIKARTRYTNMLLVLSLDYFLYSSAMNTYFENFLNIIYENIIMAENVLYFLLEHLLCSPLT